MRSGKTFSQKFLFAILAALFGCGDNVTTVNEIAGIPQLENAAALPECSEEQAGEMLFAADSGKIYYCASGVWKALGENRGENSADTFFVKDTVTVSRLDTIVLSKVDTLVILDSTRGLDGKSCTAEALTDSSGYKIVCGGDSVGVLTNGADGKTGGPDESCSVHADSNGTVLFTCGENAVALGGTKGYDPAKSFCLDDKIYELCGGKIYDPAQKTCREGTPVSEATTEFLNPEMFASESYGYLIDSRDGQLYRTVTIGNQTWMAQNLNYGYEAGTAKSYCFKDSADFCTKYGRLYTWAAAMDSAAVLSESGSDCGYGTACTAAESVRKAGICQATMNSANSKQQRAEPSQERRSNRSPDGTRTVRICTDFQAHRPATAAMTGHSTLQATAGSLPTSGVPKSIPRLSLMS